MRILFLDFDGVTVTPASKRAGGRNTAMDLVKIGMLRQLCSDLDIQIVVSSSWRRNQDMPDVFLDQWPEAPLHPDWRTRDWSEIDPDCQAHFRGVEIADWLELHPMTWSYAILDDETGFLSEQIDRVVLTDPMQGLEEHDLDRLYAIFEMKPDHSPAS